MTVFFYEDIAPKGMTNQITFLIDYLICIMNMMKEKNSDERVIIFLHYFFNDYTNHDLVSPISNILDLDFLSNTFFKNFILFDLNKLPDDFYLQWIDGNCIEYLSSKDLFWFLKTFHPLTHLSKSLKESSTNECNVRINCQSRDITHVDIPYRNHVLMVDRIQYYSIGMDILREPNTFTLFKNIRFIDESNIDLPHLLEYKKRHVIHLRLENDAVEQWWRDNDNISICESQDIYVNSYFQKYIELIERFINKDDICILLTSPSTSQAMMVKWFTQSDFTFYQKPYNPSIGRERNAILDLCIATKYGNGMFIGHSRSTFSQWISIRMTCENSLLV